jgi:limonene 1,2-monooxygenase
MAREHGTQVSRRHWRVVTPMHVAETREKARENVKFGLAAWLDYFRRVAALPLAPDGSIEDAVDALNATGFAVIGTVEDAVGQIERLETQSGGFGCLLQMAHEWADREATMKSYELIARYVMPRFQGALDGTVASRDWAAENRPTFIGAAVQAIQTEIVRHAEERSRKTRKAG